MFSERIFFLLLVLLLQNTPAVAQLSIGLSAGPNLTFLNWESGIFDFYKPAIGWRVAVPVDWTLSPLLGLRGEVALVDRSGRLDIEFTDDNGNLVPGGPYRSHFRFLEGSLLVKIAPLKNREKIYLLAGLSLSHIQKASNNIPKGPGEPPSDFPWDLHHLERSNILADIGAGWQLPLSGRHRLAFEGRVQHDLTDMSKLEPVTARFVSVALTAGYFYQL